MIPICYFCIQISMSSSPLVVHARRECLKLNVEESSLLNAKLMSDPLGTPN